MKAGERGRFESMGVTDMEDEKGCGRKKVKPNAKEKCKMRKNKEIQPRITQSEEPNTKRRRERRVKI